MDDAANDSANLILLKRRPFVFLYNCIHEKNALSFLVFDVLKC